MGKEAEELSKGKSKGKTAKKKPVKTKKEESREVLPDEKPNVLKKRLSLIIPIVIIICVIVLAWIILTPGVVAEKAKAQLIVESGNVEVRSNGGSWTVAENGMYLYESDSVRTGDDSSASIVLFETSVIRLDSNTEVTIEELIRGEETSVTIQQDSGRTWNTVNKISGIDNYEVQTPTTVASVRGTAFVVIVQENGSTYYGVKHGLLNVSKISGGVVLGSIDVSGNESVFVFIDLITGSFEVKPFEMDEWVLEMLLEDEQFFEDLKAEIYSRIEDYIPQIMDEYEITAEEIEALVEGYILGTFSLPDDAPEWVRELLEFS